MSIAVKGLTKRYGGRVIVDSIDFTIAEGELVSLLGPSGCGKTTTLRCIAGLETPDGGEIAIGGQTVFGAGAAVEPWRRDIGMVFQSYAIWPHMTVFENVAFPLRVRRAADIERRVVRALERVGLGALASRSAQQLSGGQQQRVAVARAIVHEPSVLLFDEPLSNLDARLRDQTRAEIRQLQRDLNVATIYVTHDQAEALSLSDRILVMRDGGIVQSGAPETIYAHPNDLFVAEVVGTANVFPVAQDSPTRAMGPNGTVFESAGDAPANAARAMIRPDRIRIEPAGAPGPNRLPGTIRQRLFMGGHHEYLIDTPAGTPRVISPLMFAENTQVMLTFDAADCIFLPGD